MDVRSEGNKIVIQTRNETINLEINEARELRDKLKIIIRKEDEKEKTEPEYKLFSDEMPAFNYETTVNPDEKTPKLEFY